MDDEHFAYLAAVEHGDGSARKHAHAKWTQAQYCLDLAKSVL